MSEVERPARILVVDDDPDVLRAVERVLAPLHEVRCTRNSSEAPALASEFRPDLAICDVRMPGLDGFELLERLRDTRPNIDVILMTGSMTDQDAHLVRAIRQRAFYFILKPFDREVLITLVERCLETRRLRRAQQQHLDRLQREMAAARSFQRAMLPAASGSLFGVHIEARYRSCSELGGDLFDYVEAPGAKLAFIVADVRGHGVPAALLTATVKTTFRTGASEGHGPGRISADLVRALESFSEDRFVTAFCGLLDPARGRLLYTNAGHPAGLVIGGGGEPIFLPSTAPLLSTMFAPGSWSDATITLPPRSRIFVHTDGVVESRAGGGWYPADQMINGLRAAPVGTALDTLLEDVDRFRGRRPADDDMTMLLLEMPD